MDLERRLSRIAAEAVACGDFMMAILCRQAMGGDQVSLDAISDHFGFDLRDASEEV
jgi:hypothetical protein